MLGRRRPDVRSEDDHRDLPLRQVLLIADILVAREQDLIVRLFGAREQLTIGNLAPSLFFGGLHLIVRKVPLQWIRRVLSNRMRSILMGRRVRENRLHLFDRQPKIRRDVRFIDAGFPVLDDVIRRHASTLQHGATALHANPIVRSRRVPERVSIPANIVFGGGFA